MPHVRSSAPHDVDELLDFVVGDDFFGADGSAAAAWVAVAWRVPAAGFRNTHPRNKSITAVRYSLVPLKKN